MATSVSICSSFTGTWATSMANEDSAMLVKSVPTQVRVGRPIRSQPMMKNVNEGKGLFAPAVVVVRNIVGKKQFNQLRGKAIALHSQVLETCSELTYIIFNMFLQFDQLNLSILSAGY